jgi:hypothetical protein
LSFFRRYSSHNNDNSKRQTEGSPAAKRTQRSYSHSSTDSSSSPPTKFSSNKIPCKDFFDNKGFCALGDSCPYDHGSNILTFEQPNYYPSYQQYNPETPDLIPSMYTRQPNPTGQRTLVTVVTNAEPLPIEQRIRHNDSSSSGGGPILRTKRHVITTPYPNDRRTQDRNRKRPCRF